MERPKLHVTEHTASDTILIVDDDAINRKILGKIFSPFYAVEEAENGRVGTARLLEDRRRFCAILLDVLMPGMDGYQVARQVRAGRCAAPILMLTAKGNDMDKITGLTLGADDYVTKPFRPLELVARVKAQLRRYKRYNPAQASGQEQASDLLLHSGLEMNTGTHACFLNGKPLSLTPTEFSILRILLERKGKVVSSEELFHEIWKDEYYSKSNNTITVHIRHLREKLGDTIDSPKYITTIWGVGYKIET